MTSRATNRRDLSRQAGPVRRGFTLLELLIVITIISILMTMIAVASVAFIGQARAAATRTTIKKVDEAILERVSAVNRWHQRPVTRLQHDWDIRGWTADWSQLEQLANVAFGREGQLVLSRKAVLREMLPMTQAELTDCYWFTAQFGTPAAMSSFLSDMDGDSSNGNQSLNLPGEVFYYALLNAPVYGGQRVLEDDFKSSEVVDSDVDGVPELGDAWGNPLRFYRWPTRLVNDIDVSTGLWGDDIPRKTLMPNAPNLDLKADPDDRTGFFSANPILKRLLEAFAHDADTWHAPLVVSAGPDGKLGIREPGDVDPITATPRKRGDLAEVPRGAARSAALEELYDDITNHNGTGAL